MNFAMSKFEQRMFSSSANTVFISTANYYSNNYFILTQLLHARSLAANHLVDVPSTSGSHCCLLASSSRPQSLSSASNEDKKVIGLLFPSNFVKLANEGVDLGT